MLQTIFVNTICTSAAMSVILALILIFWNRAVRIIDVRSWKVICIITLSCLFILWKPLTIMRIANIDTFTKAYMKDNVKGTTKGKEEDSTKEEGEQQSFSEASIESDQAGGNGKADNGYILDNKLSGDDSSQGVTVGVLDMNGDSESNPNSDSESDMNDDSGDNLKADTKGCRFIYYAITILSLLWLSIVCIRMVYVIVSYLHFRIHAYRINDAATPQYISALVDELSDEYDMEIIPSVYQSDQVSSPMVLGFIVPVILLPHWNYSKEDTEFILRHEMMHVKKHDILLKLLLFAAESVHWFNPLVHHFNRRMNQYIEICCDYYVLENRDITYRRNYGRSIVKLLEASVSGNPKVVMSSDFNDGKEAIMERLHFIMEKDTHRKIRHVIFAVVPIIVAVCFLFGIPWINADKETQNNYAAHYTTEESEQEPRMQILTTDNIPPQSENYKDCYTTDMTRAGNHYWIDENGTLWGTGYSEYGQLGILAEDLAEKNIPVEIAGDVIHVDYSGEYFVIYLTKDNKLYGLGGNSAGVLSKADMDNRNSTYMNVLTDPVLIMENIVYAKCGYSTIIALRKNGDVLVLGNNEYAAFLNEEYRTPRRVLDKACYVTSYYHTFAAIQYDGSLYTWGDNSLGQCGADTVNPHIDYVEEPVKVMDNIECAWMGKYGYTVSSDAGPDNLVVRDKHGDYYGCGEGIGTEKVNDYSDDLDEAHLEDARQVTASYVFQEIRVEE